ncbi:hypothetical protein Lfee_0639 [Legionella feeleii]|uniref:Uncharacterized protein n=1 Tax=Legionella feeleii TaxID=453 RepID=A0A0W0U5K2_9GAMM|nr:hypothetical protein Lfee_0639 [Legionella feeleii]SPX62327.1 Uncharacterised protein [Legionella feeleii]
MNACARPLSSLGVSKFSLWAVVFGISLREEKNATLSFRGGLSRVTSDIAFSKAGRESDLSPCNIAVDCEATTCCAGAREETIGCVRLVVVRALLVRSLVAPGNLE